MHFQHVTKYSLYKHFLSQGVNLKVVAHNEAERIDTQRVIDAVAAELGIDAPVVVVGISDEDREFAERCPVKALYKTCGEG